MEEMTREKKQKKTTTERHFETSYKSCNLPKEYLGESEIRSEFIIRKCSNIV